MERALARLRERYAIVVVTHNIGQARRIADEVAFMSEGRIVERGNHAELLAKRGKYYDLYMTQYAGFAT